MVNQKLVRLSATLLFIGALINAVLSFLHPLGAGTDQAAFTEYAKSSAWTAIHLGQFIGTAINIAGLLVIFYALDLPEGTPRWFGLFGAISAGVSLVIDAVVSAVDGVALKQAVDTWASAPATEQAARFASAEAIRWLEWGTRSYQELTFGLALVLFGIAIVQTVRLTRPVGYVLGFVGVGYIVHGWLQGTLGLQSFVTAAEGSITYGFIIGWIIWLLVISFRMKESAQAAPA